MEIVQKNKAGLVDSMGSFGNQNVRDKDRQSMIW
jgi:hypothetical protein